MTMTKMIKLSRIMVSKIVGEEKVIDILEAQPRRERREWRYRMIKEFLYSEVRDLAKAVDENREHLASDTEEALRMALECHDGIMVRPDCRFTFCDYGMGLAGKGKCPVGNPTDSDCSEFTTEWSVEGDEDTDGEDKSS